MVLSSPQRLGHGVARGAVLVRQLADRAGLTAGLSAALPSPLGSHDRGRVFAAVLTYRLATYWLPVIPGWAAWRLLQRRDYV